MYDSTLLSNYERVYYITRIFKKQEEKTCECMMPLFKKKIISADVIHYNHMY